MRVKHIIAIGLMALGMACQSPKGDKTTYEPGTRRMERVVGDIRTISSIEELDYAINHFWDGFDFECGERVVEYDTLDICQSFIDYTALLYATRDYTPLRTLIMRAESSREVLDFFMTISDMVLHDPNSPMRNDEIYIHILERLVESPLLDEYDRMIPEHDLHIARQNRLGRMANDIAYTTADGTHHRLYDIDADYTLLMFNNPDCPMCREIIDEIMASPLMNEMQELGLLRVVAIYPDADLEAWYRYLDKMPRRWVVGYDEGLKISEERSYDLRAIPSLYLLDRGKRVLVKDGVDVAYIEDVIAMAESCI